MRTSQYGDAALIAVHLRKLCLSLDYLRQTLTALPSPPALPEADEHLGAAPNSTSK